MENNSIAKIAFLKKELFTLITIVEKEKERYDSVDYSQLDDDKVGDEHEIVNSLFSMLKASYSKKPRINVILYSFSSKTPKGIKPCSSIPARVLPMCGLAFRGASPSGQLKH